MTPCTCIHPPSHHDPVTGACLNIAPTLGPCPCAATSEATHTALDTVFREHLQPAWYAEWESAKNERARLRAEGTEQTRLLTKLLFGPVEDIAVERARAKQAAKLLLDEHVPNGDSNAGT